MGNESRSKRVEPMICIVVNAFEEEFSEVSPLLPLWSLSVAAIAGSVGKVIVEVEAAAIVTVGVQVVTIVVSEATGEVSSEAAKASPLEVLGVEVGSVPERSLKRGSAASAS